MRLHDVGAGDAAAAQLSGVDIGGGKASRVGLHLSANGTRASVARLNVAGIAVMQMQAALG